jgi:superfamily II DNA or RNA helicase
MGFSAFQVDKHILDTAMILNQDMSGILGLEQHIQPARLQRHDLFYDVLPAEDLLLDMFGRIESITLRELNSFQKDLVKATISLKDLVVQKGCGGGKTFTTIALAGSFKYGIIFMVCPTRAAQNSVEQAATRLGIGHKRYTRFDTDFMSPETWDVHNEVRVVSVVIDTALAGHSGFLNFVGWMDKRGLVIRLVVDEAHELYSSLAYRPSVRYFEKLFLQLTKT